MEREHTRQSQHWRSLNSLAQACDTYLRGRTVMKVLSRIEGEDGSVRFVVTPANQGIITAEIVVPDATDVLTAVALVGERR